MKLPYDLLSGTYVKPRVFLCETDKTKICQLETTDTSGTFRFNSYSEIEFTVGRTYEDFISGERKVNPYYDKIEALRLIYLEGFGYFEIQDPEMVSDGIKEEKIITAYSLEYNLSQKYLEDFLINTGEIGSVEVTYAEEHETGIVPVTLYNPINPELSLLHLALEKIYGWTIGHVDASLRTMSRQFDISRESVYDFLTQDVCDKFNCFFVFDTIENTINVYAESLITKFIGDGSTTVFIVTSKYDTLSTVSINSYKTTAYTYNHFTGELVFDTAPINDAIIEVVDGSQEQWTTDVYISFDNLAQEANVSYSADDIKTILTVKGADDLDIREVNYGLPYITDLSYYYTVDWMGQDLYSAYGTYLKKCNEVQNKYTINSQEMLEIASYIDYLTHRLSLKYSIASVSSSTVGTYYVRGGTAPNYYYTEVSLPSEYKAATIYYTLSGNDLNKTKFADFYEALKVYYTSGNSKTVKDIEALSEEFAFMEDYTINELASDLSKASSLSDKDAAVSKFLDLLWDQLGLAPMENLYYKPYEEIQKANIKAGWNDKSSEYYWSYYPVTVVLASLDKAKEKRQAEIDEKQAEYNAIQSENKEISSSLLLTNNFTSKQLIRLSSFLREDEYTDDNFVETESDTIESLMKTKQELLECGRIELAKLCEPKLEFSMSMANIYALEEFEPIIHQFQLGKLINVAIRDDYIKRARLLEVSINFDDFSDFSCEFGELTSLKTPSSIHADLLASALSAGKSVASNASYWNKGSDLATSTDLKIQQGLLGAIDGLYNSDQSVIIDENGILLRKVNEDGSFSPHQAWLTSNTILLSDDGFKTARVGLGEFEVDNSIFYGILSEAMISGYIEGCTIVGGTINIGNGRFKVDQNGNVTMNASAIVGNVGADNIISSINQSPETIAINANRISLAGKTIDLTSDNIIIDSTNFSVTKDGQITATSGEIAGWAIYDNLLRKETTIGNVTYQMYMQPADGVNTTNAFAVRKKNVGDTAWDTQFAVNYLGKMTAKNANITGTITATDGSIAGYKIGSGGSYDNALYKRVSGDISDYEIGLKATNGDTDLAFYVKESTDNWSSNSNTFFVRNNGQLYAQKADITGKITASSGSIGSWKIGNMDGYKNSIYSTYCAASTPSATNPEYAVFMRGEGSSASTIAIGIKKRTSSSVNWEDSDNTETPFYVRKDGYVKMSNANVTGTINASDGNISGNLNISGSLINTRGNYTVTLRGVQSDVGKGVFYITDKSSDTTTYPVRINGDGSASFTNVSISGNSTIAAACIPNLSAAKITSGTISTNVLDASVITSSNFSSKTLSTSKLTMDSGCRLGSANEYNAKLYSTGGYTWMEAFTPDSSYLSSIMNIVRAGVTLASSRDIKSEIHGFDDRYDVFFDKLNPQLFKYNFEQNLGYSMGFIWEEAVKAMTESGLSSNDVGAIHESDGTVGGKVLRKDDFVALNTWQIQKLKDRVKELENRLAALEA